LKTNKWTIAAAAVGLHISIGSVYAWSVLVNPIIQQCGFSLTATTFIFSIAIFFLGVGASTFGKYVDKYGAKKVSLIGTLLFVTGFLGSAYAVSIHSLMLLYLFYGCFVGCATGICYVSPVSTLMKYFYKHPGIGAGICIAGFGASATIASPLMNYLVTNYGLVNNFLIMGTGYGILMLCSSCLFAPPPTEALKKILKNDPGVPPQEAYKSWPFKALFFTFYINIACGIAILALLSPMLQSDFGFDAVTAASFVGLVGIANCTGRFIWASLSDVLTRPITYIIFAGLGLLMYLSSATISNLFIFEISILTIISMYGGFFSCMPAYINDIWGKKHLSTIHGKILLAWGCAGISSPIALSYCKDITGSYMPMMCIFVLGMFINLCILWKLRKMLLEQKSQEVDNFTNIVKKIKGE